MTEKAPKSALEIAMEKLKERDREQGSEAPARLTGAQKKAIGEIRRKAEARIAEMEIFFKSNRAGSTAEPETLQKMEQEYARDRRRVEEKMEADVARVRKTGAGHDA